MVTKYRLGVSGRYLTLPSTHKNADKYFYTKEEAKADYLAKQKTIKDRYESGWTKANEMLDNMEYELYELGKKYGGSVSYTYDGDSHGICDESLTISVNYNGNEYTRCIEG